jgi:hypothetical protein
VNGRVHDVEAVLCRQPQDRRHGAQLQGSGTNDAMFAGNDIFDGGQQPAVGAWGG